MVVAGEKGSSSIDYRPNNVHHKVMEYVIHTAAVKVVDKEGKLLFTVSTCTCKCIIHVT